MDAPLGHHKKKKIQYKFDIWLWIFFIISMNVSVSLLLYQPQYLAQKQDHVSDHKRKTQIKPTLRVRSTPQSKQTVTNSL